MKKLITILAAVLLTATLWAQSPEKMSYQAVIRNSANALVTNTQVGMQINILQGSATGTQVYTETITPTTNAKGLVSVEIGSAAGFGAIDWADGPYFIETKTDIAGGTNYTITGTSQLLSVPYALHAKTATTAETVTSYTETDPEFAAWNKTTGISITESQISDLKTYLTSYTETDPVFAAAVASSIAATDTAYWNAKLDSYTETDPLFIASVASAITAADTTYWNKKDYADLTNKPVNATTTVDGFMSKEDKTALDAAQTEVETLQTKLADIESKLADLLPKTIGQTYGGGIVFYVDGTGMHGLIAATEDQDGGSGIQWYNGNYTTTGATGDALYAGATNTATIITSQGDGSYAAQVCADYNGGGYTDWYLPSQYELNLLYKQKATVGGFASASYWGSTEISNDNAWGRNFYLGFQGNYGKGDTNRVRAVRAF